MRLSLMLFSTLQLTLLSCASAPTPVPVPIHWEMIDVTPFETKACLPEADVKSLAERLVRAERAAAKCSK